MPLFVLFGWDSPQSPELRPVARPAHLAHWKDWVDSGRVIMAGPMTDFAGSMFIVKADSIEEAAAKIAADPYVAGGIFQRTEVHPFKATLPPGKWDDLSV